MECVKSVFMLKTPFQTAILICLLALSSVVFSQDPAKVDSLKKELARFEIKKKANKSKASKYIDTTKVKLLHAIAKEYMNIDPDKAVPYTQSALTLSSKINYKRGLGEAYNNLGVYHDFKHDYLKAINYYEKALKLRSETKEIRLVGYTYMNIGVVYQSLGDYPKALKSLLSAVEMAKKSKDEAGVFGAYNNLGILYSKQKNYKQSLRYYFDCLKLKPNPLTAVYVSNVHQNIGDIYLELSQSEKAIHHYNLGLATGTKTGNIVSVAGNTEGLGKVYSYQKNYNKALSNYIKSRELREKMGYGHGVAVADILIGETYFKLGSNQKAIERIHEGLGVMEQSGNLDGQRQGYRLLSEIYASQGNYKKAFDNQVAFKKVNDSIYNEAKQQELTEIRLKNQFKTIEEANKIKQIKKDLLAKNELENQKNIKIFSILALLLTTIFFIVLLYQRNKMAKIRRQKALEEERNRISRDLHDNLGTQLSTVRMFVNSIKNKGSQEIAEKVDDSIALLDNSITELRTIMHEMSSSVLIEKGYLQATEALVNKINELHLINFTLSSTKIEKRFDAKIEHELYRVTQELINNTIKYSGAKNVSIDLILRDNLLVLMYEDDGVGYDVSSVKRGNGLHNIETRIQSVGGTVDFDSKPNFGARAIIEIPV